MITLNQIEILMALLVLTPIAWVLWQSYRPFCLAFVLFCLGLMIYVALVISRGGIK